MKYRYEISRMAIKDLENIWMYTAENWSKQQANAYYRKILKTIDNICRNPGIGKPIGEIKKEHKRVNIKSHLIIYKTSESKIFIDRILHQKMDLDHLLE